MHGQIDVKGILHGLVKFSNRLEACLMNRTDLSFLKGFVSCGLQTVEMMLRLSCYFQTYTRFTVCILSILNGDVFHANDLLLVWPCCLLFF